MNRRQLLKTSLLTIIPIASLAKVACGNEILDLKFCEDMEKLYLKHDNPYNKSKLTDIEFTYNSSNLSWKLCLHETTQFGSYAYGSTYRFYTIGTNSDLYKKYGISTKNTQKYFNGVKTYLRAKYMKG